MIDKLVRNIFSFFLIGPDMYQYGRRYQPSGNFNARDDYYPRMPPPPARPDFSRWDYSHDFRAPRLVPFVREYEHGLGNIRDIPVVDTSIPPPPIIYNSVSHNPSLFDSFRRHAVFDPSINQSNLPVFVDQGLPGAPCPPMPSAYSFNHPSPGVPNDLQQLQAELAQAKADIIQLKLGASGGVGAANPSDTLPEEVQDMDCVSQNEGIP